MNKIKKLSIWSDRYSLTLLIIAVFIFVIMGGVAPKTFLSLTNLQGMCVQFPEFGILAFGMMLCMISGGIDLSLVGIANLSGIIASVVMIRLGNGGGAIAGGVTAALLTGAVCGLINGFFVGYLTIPPMLVTLCGLQLYTGLGLAVTKGPAMTGLPKSFGLLANGAILMIPIVLILFIAIALLMNYLLNSTIYGEHVKYLGSNENASRYSGIHNLSVILKTYMISGVLGSISGLVMISHYNSAKADYGSTYTLLTLLIVVLGGTAPEGGKGKVFGVTLSVIVLQLVSSAFNILRLNAYIKTFVWGLILIAVMTASYISSKRKT